MTFFGLTISDMSEVLKSVSIIGAAFMAIYGINAWQREFVGKRRLELAEETLSLFYQARDAIASMRHPFSFGGEGSSRKAGAHESPAMKESLDQAFVLAERYNSHSELFSKISSLRFRFMAMLGEQAAQPFSALAEILGKIQVAANTRMWRSRSSAV
jgi:hypothetical protein